MIKDTCKESGLNLGDTDVIMDELSEWKLYQLHKSAKKKDHRSRSKKSSNGNVRSSDRESEG